MRAAHWVIGGLVGLGSTVLGVSHVQTGSAFAAASVHAPETPETLPEGAIILPEDQAARLLHQCGRNAPSPNGPTWQPSAGEIRRLEAQLPAALNSQREADDPDWSRAPSGWFRQYVGIVRGGRRLIYGSFDTPQPREDRWRREALIVCDGGRSIFGVEYDADAHRIVRLAFNGVR